MSKSHTRVVFASLFAAIFLCGCTIQVNTGGSTVKGSGVKSSETREVGAFRAVELSGSPNVEITIGDKPEVVVEADDNVVPIILTEVSNGTLRIYNKAGFNTSIGVNVRIVTPTLESVTISGSGDIHIAKLKEKSFAATISGSGSVKAEGEADSVQAKVTGSGGIDLTKVAAKKATAVVSGSGGIKVNASEDLSANITGSGDIRYNGRPRLDSRVTGSGRVSGL